MAGLADPSSSPFALRTSNERAEGDGGPRGFFGITIRNKAVQKASHWHLPSSQLCHQYHCKQRRATSERLAAAGLAAPTSSSSALALPSAILKAASWLFTQDERSSWQQPSAQLRFLSSFEPRVIFDRALGGSRSCVPVIATIQGEDCQQANCGWRRALWLHCYHHSKRKTVNQ